MDKEYKTVYLKDAVIMCDHLDDLKSRILPMINTQQEQWASKVNEIIKENGYTKKDFAERCGVSRVTVDKWCKGSIPKSRKHGRFENMDGIWFYLDNNGKNGTVYNDKHIDPVEMEESSQ